MMGINLAVRLAIIGGFFIMEHRIRIGMDRAEDGRHVKGVSVDRCRQSSAVTKEA